MAGMSKHDLHDPTHEKSNITRAINLWRRSHLPQEEFIALIRGARKITLDRSASIRKKADNYMGLTNRAPYFFKVLHDLILRTTLEKFRDDFVRRKNVA